MMEETSRVFVAGVGKAIGRAIYDALLSLGFKNIITDEEIDLSVSSNVEKIFIAEKPEYIFCAAGKSGGILANQNYPADFIFNNIMIASNVIHAAHRHQVKKLMYLAASCVYPKLCKQPMKENYLLTGSLEPTNESYALAKIAGIKICQAYQKQYSQNFISGIPANCFGPGDDFSIDNSHVIGALMRKMHEAKMHKERAVDIWGTGKPTRDFIYVKDLAKACIFAMKQYDGEEPINLGLKNGISIRDLAVTIKKVTKFEGELVFDTSRPDGMPEKILDNRKLDELGWRPKWELQDALNETYCWFIDNYCKKEV